MPKSIAVIGGGAAGFFAALSAKSANPNCNVFILENIATHQILHVVMGDLRDDHGLQQVPVKGVINPA